MVDESQRDVMLRMLNGYQVSQAIHVAGLFGVADTLKDGARDVDDIADETDTDPEALYRLMRALAALGVFLEGDQRKFSLTPLGSALVEDTHGSVRDYAIFVGHESNWGTWGNLLHGIRNGENVFRQVHGTTVWKYREQRPEVSAMFNRATAATKLKGSILDIYDFSPFRLIVDVGGGNGAMLADVLNNNPLAQGILFDQPHVVSRDQLETVGVADRCEQLHRDLEDLSQCDGRCRDASNRRAPSRTSQYRCADKILRSHNVCSSRRPRTHSRRIFQPACGGWVSYRKSDRNRR